MSIPTMLRTSLVTLVALGATAALAHAELDSSSPDDGETLTTAPTQVELVFSESVEVDFSTFKVYPLPDDLAAAAAETAHDEAMTPLDDSDSTLDDDADDTPSDDNHDNSASHDDSSTGSDVGSDDADDHSGDTNGNASDDSSDDHGDDHSLDSSSSDLAAFVEGVLSDEGDEAARVDTGVSSQGSKVSIELSSDLAPGGYVVMWSALSSDTHPVEGYITFFYAP